METKELKERFIKVWGVILWEYFQKAGHQTCDDTIFRIELDELLEQHADKACKNFGCFIHRENAKAIEGGLEAIKKLPESIDEWFDDWKFVESHLSKQL